MVSDDAVNYAIGNLLAGPSQWKNMYATGAGFAFTSNVILAHLNLVPALYPSLGEAQLEIYVVELVNAFIPLVAFFFDRPEKAIMTAGMYILFGLVYWTAKYEIATSGRQRGRRGRRR